jgi:NAD(P)-dependent dehydrogenase (short-subunit alcohol dehydrogenase family)
MARFKDQVVVVVGGASGIGARTAERFADEGAAVVIIDRNPSEVDAVRASAVADVTDPVALASAFDTAEEVGPISTVVNAAGISARAQLIVDFDPQAWLRTLEVNLLGSMLVGAQAVRRMADTGGSIVFVSSNVARRGLPYRSDYVASKWGMLGLAQTLALEAVDHGIRVNSVLPGPVDTPLLWEVVDYHAEVEGKTREQVAEEWRVGAPMKRYPEADEVANVIMFLASDASSAMTGQALNVTCGALMT